MLSLNQAQIIGHLGRDPEIRSTQSGNRVANLSVATSEAWMDKNSGERKERTEWHRVTIFDEKLVEVAEKYLKKGSKVFLEGQIQTRKWTDQSGQDKWTTEIVLQRFRSQLIALDKAEKTSQGPGERASALLDAAGHEREVYDTATPADDPDSEIPF